MNITNILDIQNTKFNDNEIISFDVSIQNTNIIDCLLAINEYEQTHNINLRLDLKDIDYSIKKTIVKYVLTHKNILNKDIIHNIMILIRSHNTLSDTFFNSSHIYYNSLDELLNIKLDMMEEILEFKKYITGLFFSMMKSLNKFKFSPLDFCIKFSSFDDYIFNELDFLTLSSLISTIDYSYNFAECPYLYDAEIYFSRLVVNHMQTVCLVEHFLNRIK